MNNFNNLPSDIDEELMQQALDEGMKTYQSVRENGFRRTYEQRFTTQVNYDLPEVMFDFTYFIASITMADVSTFLNNLSKERANNEKVNELFEAFELTINQIIAGTMDLAELASTAITFKSPSSKPEWEDLYHAQRDYISRTMEISTPLITLQQVLVGNDIDIDGEDELLEDLKEFYLAMEKIEELSNNINSGGTI